METISGEEFARVVRKNQKTMFRLARSVLDSDTQAEDAIAEAVLSAWEKRYQVKDIKRFDAWLLKITINKARSMKNRRQREFPVPEVEETQPEKLTVGEQDEIWEYVHKLKDKYKILIILHYYENRSIKEMAEITGLMEGTVKSRLYRARNMLKEMIPYDMVKSYHREVN